MGLIRVKKTEPCQVCGTYTKGCSHDPDSQLYFCRGSQSNGSFKLIKELDNGYRIYKESQYQQDFDPDAWRKNRIERDRAEAEVRKNKLKLGDYSELLSELIERLSLSEDHKRQLTEKGLNDPFKAGYRTLVNGSRFPLEFNNLPGFVGGRYIGHSGILCPIKDVWGNVTGFQVKTDNAESGKYVWTTDNEVKANLKSGELPMNVVVADRSSKQLGLIEGTLKPVIASQMHGLNLIGASGGHFQPIQLRQTIQKLKPETVVFYPDAGAVANPDTYRRDCKMLINLRALAQKLNFSLSIAFWGQLHDKAVGDLDEIAPDTKMVSLSVGDYLNFENPGVVESAYRRLYDGEGDLNLFEIAKSGKAIKDSVKRRQIKFTGVESEFVSYKKGRLPDDTKAAIKFKESDRVELLHDALPKFKVILDQSGCGTGKSHGIDKLDLDRLFSGVEKRKLIYLSKSPLQPPTEAIERNFIPFLGRTKGFSVVEGKANPSGLQMMRRTKEGEQEQELGNCRNADAIVSLRQARSDVNVCKMCALRSDCASFDPAVDEKIDAYGFLAQASRVMKSEKIRMNFNALQPSMITENTVLIADEISQGFEYTQETRVTFYELINAIALVCDIELEFGQDPTITALKGFLLRAKKAWQKFLTLPQTSNLYAYAHEAFLKMVGLSEWDKDLLLEGADKLRAKLEAINTEFVANAMRNYVQIKNPMKSWCDVFVRVCYGLESGAIRIDKDLVITSKNSEGVSNLLRSKSLLVLDATLTREYLARMLDINHEDILVISQEVPKADRLEVEMLVGAGNFLKNRSERQTATVCGVRSSLESAYGDGLGVIDYGKHSNKGDLNHFSDGRGSNAYQDKKAILIVGIPFSNLGAQADVFRTLYREPVCQLDGKISINSKFEQVYQNNTLAELTQELGRLRYNRRSEDLKCYLLGDVNIDDLADSLGFNLKYASIAKSYPELASPQELKRHRILEAYETLTSLGQEATQKAIAGVMRVKQPQIAKAARDFGGFRRFKAILDLILRSKVNPDELDKVSPDLKLAAMTFIPELIPLAGDADAHLEEFRQTLEVIATSNGVSEGTLVSMLPDETMKSVLTQIVNLAPYSYRSYLYSQLTH